MIPVAALYGGWNLFFWLHGRPAPSIFQSFTGLPCPSSGCMRSLHCWFAGEWGEALRFNPFTWIFIGLLIASAGWLLWKHRQKQPLRLPAWFGNLWISVLALAWLAKFALGRAYW